jgi:5-methylcytosine-specific restriction endonuclease McrA
MPMDRSRYPKEWDAIALKIKEASDWKCQECGLDCRRTDESLDRSSKAKRTLTVHHWDCDPSNNHQSNLIALCSACHLKKHTGRRGNVSQGQLSLLRSHDINHRPTHQGK